MVVLLTGAIILLFYFQGNTQFLGNNGSVTLVLRHLLWAQRCVTYCKCRSVTSVILRFMLVHKLLIIKSGTRISSVSFTSIQMPGCFYVLKCRLGVNLSCGDWVSFIHSHSYILSGDTFSPFRGVQTIAWCYASALLILNAMSELSFEYYYCTYVCFKAIIY